MRKVTLFSALLVVGLVLSQVLPSALGDAAPGFATAVRLLTMLCLGFVMIHVGYEFELDKARWRDYVVDYGVAFTAAAFPWVFCAVYFVAVLGPPGGFTSWEPWKEALLSARFASPTSAGVLFSMLAAAGLAGTWLFRKARVLAIFDDLDTVLLMIPLKMMIVGPRWQLLVIVAVMAVLLTVAWRKLHAVRWPVSWPFVLGYAAVIVAVLEGVYVGSLRLDDSLGIHIEVLLPAFVLGCVLARPAGSDPHRDDAREGHQEGPEAPAEQRVATIVSAAFMVLVGLSMPSFSGGGGLSPGALALHVLAVTVVSNVGKLYPAFCYKTEATVHERIALAVGMFPRGEVGAGVLVVSLSLGVTGPMIQVAVLSLALNLVLTGAFIAYVRARLRRAGVGPAVTPAVTPGERAGA